MRGGKKAKEVMLALVRTGSLSVGLTHTHVRSFPRFLSLSLCFLKLTTSSNTLNGSACSLSLFSDGTLAVAAGCSAEELLWMAEI